MSTNLKKMHQDIDRYTGGYSRGYLDAWCQFVHQEWTEFLDRAFTINIPQAFASIDTEVEEKTDTDRDENVKERLVLDVGCGPSISNIISASKWSQNIIMADFLESNRKEVERFWTNAEDSFCWEHYFRFIGVLELNPDIDSICKRTRNAIKGVYYCDITTPEIFVVPVGQFDVIIASLVFDVVAVSDKMFIDALQNVLQFLKPGGVILIHGSLHEEKYSVGASLLPVMNVDEVRLRNIFETCKLTLLKLELSVKITTHYYTMLQKSISL